MRAVLLKNTFSHKEKTVVLRFLQRQCMVALVLSIIAMAWGILIAADVVLGGLLVIIPNSIFAMYLFSGKKLTSPEKLVKACYIGEILKILAIILLLSLILHYFNVKLAPLLVGFCGTYCVYLSAFL